MTKIWGRDLGKNTKGPRLVAECKAARGKLPRVPSWLFYAKLTIFSRAPWEKRTISQPLLEMRRQARKVLQCLPSDSLTDTLKTTKFSPTPELGTCPPVPPRDVPD